MGKKIEKQAGTIPYRSNNGELEVLLITSRTRGRWIIPKGNIEDDLTARESARLEAFEEAGVTGRVSKSPMGTYKHTGSSGNKKVKVYLMKVKDQSNKWPEKHQRDRKWMSVKKAKKKVFEKGLKKLLDELLEELG